MKLKVANTEIHFNVKSEVINENGSLEIIEPDFNLENSQLKRQFCMRIELSTKQIKINSAVPCTQIFVDQKGHKRLIAKFI